MGFLGVYRAIYDYAPQGDEEIEITEGDLLFILEKSTEDDWWRARKKVGLDVEEEPEGLIPNNYVEPATPAYSAKALYDYERQTDEELNLSEDAMIDVYDTSDPDWTLAGFEGEFGFVPANYIEEASESPPPLPRTSRPVPVPQPEPEDEPEEDDYASPASPASPPSNNPAAALAGILNQRATAAAVPTSRELASPPLPTRPQAFTPEESDEEEPKSPPLPQRPRSEALSPPPMLTPESSGVRESMPYNRAVSREYDEQNSLASPGGYYLYHIHEMVSHMGKSKKMPMTLGLNLAKGVVMIAPAKERDGPQKEWTAEKLSNYSIEGKHVFMDLVRPSKSVDFHAGAKDTAEEIVSRLGELAGASRAEGLREIIAAGTGAGMKTGQMLYDFMAQGDDEVTVAAGDEVVVLDDVRSEEWWQVRRLKNGKEGVVPSSYVEVTGVTEAAKSPLELNRLEEERLAREASKSHKRRSSDVNGSNLALPERSSSMYSDGRRESKGKRESRTDSKSSSGSKPKPDPSRVRTWTDRSGTFKVDAQFLGLKDGKIHLHKLNGVKIAVPVTKMSLEDIEHVERATGVSLDEEKPLSDIKKRGASRKDRGTAGASVEAPKRPEYDWFDFFLQCGVNPQICERYAQAFSRDQMGEENMADLDPSIMRTLGLKEGDILRVMKFLDAKYARTSANQKRNVSFSVEGEVEDGGSGLFSGPGGALRNNTRKGRPSPATETSDVVDGKLLQQGSSDKARANSADLQPTPLSSAPPPPPEKDKASGGFDDNAWEVKPSKQPQVPSPARPEPSAQSPAPAQPAPAPAPAPPTGALAELSLLTPPLQPTQAPQPAPQPQPPQQSPPTAAPSAPPQPIQQPQQPQQTGANPSFFDQLPSQQPQQVQVQPTGPPRQRPQAPQQGFQSSLIAPPPARAQSVPQNLQQQSAFNPPPLQAQLTGYPTGFGGAGAQQAPPGQSMQDLNNQRFQPQPTGFGNLTSNVQSLPNHMAPQPTGFNQFGGQQQVPQIQLGFNNSFQGQGPTINGNQTGSPFADPSRQQFQPLGPQPTGFQPNNFSQAPMQPQATGVNAFLPPALQPQRTGFNLQPQQTGFGQQAFQQQQQQQQFQPPPVPPMPTGFSQQQSSLQPLQPLQPQKTGPAPPVRFGVQPANKLAPQPTGRRANLSQATPQNPFGF